MGLFGKNYRSDQLIFLEKKLIFLEKKKGKMDKNQT